MHMLTNFRQATCSRDSRLLSNTQTPSALPQPYNAKLQTLKNNNNRLMVIIIVIINILIIKLQ